jgi:hypothetical protein
MRPALAALVVVAVMWLPVRAQEPALGTVLSRAAAYVADYQTRLAAIVSEEHYRQQVINSARRNSGRQHRELRSDVLLVKPGESGDWLQFRDVFEVDRKPVRDRDQRLYRLFVEADADREQRVQIIQQESARYNIGPVQRTINIPIMGMLFFDRPNQPMSQFKRGESGNVRALVSLAPAADIWTVEFKETQSGTMVRGAWGRDVPSHGRAWIDSTTGRILRTEHISVDTFVRAEIDVSYRTEPGLDVLIPGDMRESYVVVQQAGNIVIYGHATYSRFRQFTVTTTEKPKPQ